MGFVIGLLVGSDAFFFMVIGMDSGWMRNARAVMRSMEMMMLRDSRLAMLGDCER